MYLVICLKTSETNYSIKIISDILYIVLNTTQKHDPKNEIQQKSYK